MNPLFHQLTTSLPPQNTNNMLQQFLNFKKNFTGNPQQIINNMVNSGQISQAQLSQYTQQANDMYKAIFGDKNIK